MDWFNMIIGFLLAFLFFNHHATWNHRIVDGQITIGKATFSCELMEVKE